MNMSKSSVGRLSRNPAAPIHYGNGQKDHRKALPYLEAETGERCAYSCQHKQRANGDLEVDHFNPAIPHPLRNVHENLLPASRHCNGRKWKYWPLPFERKKGAKFLNPYTEMDYGKHLFEHPDTHEIVGVTIAGKWHIMKLDLNAPHLIRERRDRAAIRRRLESPALQSAMSLRAVKHATELLKEQFDQMIPPLPEIPRK
jgi:hypothetical protein